MSCDYKLALMLCFPDRTLMNYAALDFKSLSLNEQKGLILLFCNMFATESRRWLMYFSEWETDAGDVTSNAKVINIYCFS